ncbi:unnamed protein product [Rotaria sp. Silwood1]|nr:unnamed protein product [Rotaria sp. Silwood1]
MGSKSSTSAASSPSLTAAPPSATTKTNTGTPLPPPTTTMNSATDHTTTITSPKTNSATTTTNTITNTIATATTPNPNPNPIITSTTTTTTPTPTITSTATKTIPTPTITSAGPTIKNTSTTPVSTESNSKPTFFSIAKSLTSDAENTKPTVSSAYARWYKYSKFEKQQRDKGKALWYMSSSVTSTDTLSTTTTSLTMTTAQMSTNNQKDISDASNITAMPSFQLRSTAIYSPPHGDRVLSGRNELINTDVSNFKYYIPDNRSKQPVGQHTRATMYNMNTQSKQITLPTPSSSSPTTNSNGGNNTTGDNATVPTFVSRGLQTDLEVQPIDPSATQMLYYEKQKPQIVPVSALSNYTSNNNGFFHLSSNNTVSQPVFSSTEPKPSVRFNDQPDSSVNQSVPYYPPPPPPTSILKKPSTVLPQENYNPLSIQTHDEVLEELRKRNNNTNDGVYRVKKVHIIEKDDRENQPINVSFNPSPSKASQSILRSERLLFNQ